MFRHFRLSSFSGAERFTLTVPGEWPACNPSIAKDGDGFRVIVRTVNYRLKENGYWLCHPPGGAQTINWLLHLDRDLQTLRADRIDDRDVIAREPRAGNGLEDARSFRWRNGWWFSASAVRFMPAGFWSTFDNTYSTICICRLGEDNRVTETHFIESPLRQEKEKNWMPAVDGDALKLIYRISPLQIVDVADDGQGSLRSLGVRSSRIDGWSGSSQLAGYRNGWLCVVHNRIEKGKCLYYEHAFVELSRDFKILRVSRPWYFDERTVEFCAGLCVTADSVILSYGYMDREARLLRLPLRIVEDLLEDSWRSRIALRLAYWRGRRN